jgi:hypothetical protein
LGVLLISVLLTFAKTFDFPPFFTHASSPFLLTAFHVLTG